MELSTFFGILRRQLGIIVATTVAGALLGLGITAMMPKTYSASTQTYFTVDSADLTQGSAFAEGLLKSYAAAAESDLVLAPAATKLGVTTEELSGKLNFVIPSGTSIIEITAEDQDPAMAAKIANTVTEELQGASKSLSPDQMEGKTSTGKKAVRFTQLDSAKAPTSPSAPHLPLNVALGAFGGFLLGLLAALLRDGRTTRKGEFVSPSRRASTSIRADEH